MPTLEEFIRDDIPYLFSTMSAGRYGYWVEKRGDKMRHFPPKKANCSLDQISSFNARGPITSYGVRGVSINEPFKTGDSQPAWLHWCGIDVDQEHNAERAGWQDTLWELVSGVANIRASKSGLGRHVIFKFDKPYEFAGVTAAARAAGSFLIPWVEKIETAGIKTCVSGLPNFWLWSEGGHQNWISKTATVHPLTTYQKTRVLAEPVGDTVAVSLSESVGRYVLEALIHGRVLPARQSGETLYVPRHHNINVGAVKRAMAILPDIPINTQSKCRIEHENEPNGFIAIDEYSISLFSSADNTGPGAGWLFKIPLET